MRVRGLQVRFMLVVIAGASLFAALTGAVGYFVAYQRTLDAAHSQLDDLAAAVEKTAAIAAFTADKPLLQEVIDGLARSTLAGRIIIRGTDGTVLAQRKVAAQDAADARLTLTRQLMSPFDAHEKIGVLTIEGDVAKMKRAAETQASTLAMLLVCQTALIAVLLYVAAARLVSKPIEDFARSLRTMKPGTRARLKASARHSDDEIGSLVAGANELLDANEVALRRERKLRAQVQAMEAQYRRIFDSSSAGIFVIGSDGRLINGNPTVLKFIGSPVMQIRHLKGLEFIQLVFARPDAVQSMIEESAKTLETVSADLQLVQHDGSPPRWVHCLISVQEHKSSRPERNRLIEGVMYDVTARKRSEEAMQHQAEHDPLTGLKNRLSVEATLDRYLIDAQVNHAAVSVLYVDLDGFKKVNDTLGHKAGDQVLVQCAHRMRSAVRRSSDLVGRLGGDEFIVLLYNCGPADLPLMQTATQLVKSLSEPIVLDDGQVAQVSASVGIACYPKHGASRRQLMTQADDAMYGVKRTGKRTFALAWQPPPHEGG